MVTLRGTKEDSLMHVWLHSQFMEHPPDAMAGTARVLDDAECARRAEIGTGVPRAREGARTEGRCLHRSTRGRGERD